MSSALQLPVDCAVGQPKAALLSFAKRLYIYPLSPAFFAQVSLGIGLVSVTILLSVLSLYRVYRDGNFWILRTRGRFLVSNPTTGFLLGLMTYQMCFLGFLVEQIRVYQRGHLPTQMGYWFSGIWFPLWGAAYFAVAGSYFMGPDVCEFTPPYRASWLRRIFSRPVITNTIHVATPIIVFATAMATMSITGSSYQEAVYAWQIWAAVVNNGSHGTITEQDRQGALEVWQRSLRAWKSAETFFTFALVLCLATVLVYTPVAFQVCQAIRRRICEMRYPTGSNMANVLAVPLWGESNDVPVERPSAAVRLVAAGGAPPPLSELPATTPERVTMTPSTLVAHEAETMEERLRMMSTAYRHVVFQAITVHGGVLLVACIALVCRLKAVDWAARGPAALARSWSAMVLFIMYSVVVAGFVALFTVRRRHGTPTSGSVRGFTTAKGITSPSPLSGDTVHSIRRNWSQLTHMTRKSKEEVMRRTDSMPMRPKPTRRRTLRGRGRLQNACPETCDTWLGGLGGISSRFTSFDRPSSEREIIDLEVGPHEVLASIRPSPRGRTGGGLYEGFDIPPDTPREFEDDEESLSNLFGPNRRGSDGPERQQTRDTLFIFGFSQRSSGSLAGKRPGTASSMSTQGHPGAEASGGGERDSESVGSLREFRWMLTPPSIHYEPQAQDPSRPQRRDVMGQTAADGTLRSPNSLPTFQDVVRP